MILVPKGVDERSSVDMAERPGAHKRTAGEPTHAKEVTTVFTWVEWRRRETNAVEFLLVHGSDAGFIGSWTADSGIDSGACGGPFHIMWNRQMRGALRASRREARRRGAIGRTRVPARLFESGGMSW